jgi:hypothetical protein
MLTSDWIIRIVLFSLVHWVLAGFMLNDLASRKKVVFHHKALWAIVVLIIPCFGSLFYLMFHPQIVTREE